MPHPQCLSRARGSGKEPPVVSLTTITRQRTGKLLREPTKNWSAFRVSRPDAIREASGPYGRSRNAAAR